MEIKLNRRIASIFGASALLCGCAATATAPELTLTSARGMADVSNLLLLDNVLNARDGLPINFFAIDTIKLKPNFTTSSNISIPVNLNIAPVIQSFSVSETAGTRDELEIVLAPVNTQKVQRDLSTPGNSDTVALLAASGVPLEVAMMLLIEEVRINYISDGNLDRAADALLDENGQPTTIGVDMRPFLSQQVFRNTPTSREEWDRFRELVENLVTNGELKWGIRRDGGDISDDERAKGLYRISFYWCFDNINYNLTFIPTNLTQDIREDYVILETHPKDGCGVLDIVNSGGIFDQDNYTTDTTQTPLENLALGVLSATQARDENQTRTSNGTFVSVNVQFRSYEGILQYLGEILRRSVDSTYFNITSTLSETTGPLIRIEKQCESSVLMNIDENRGGGYLCTGPWNSVVMNALGMVYALQIDRDAINPTPVLVTDSP